MKKIPTPIIALAASLAIIPTLAFADLQTGVAAYKRKNYTTAYEMLLPVAQQGDVEAQRLLGYLYLHGRGTPENQLEASKWFKLAADQGDAESMRRMGGILTQGRGVTQDLDEALKWYGRSGMASTKPQYDIDQSAFEWTRYDEAHAAFAKCARVNPVMPNLAVEKGTIGAVRARLVIAQGVAQDVIILSGPKIYHDAAVQALIRYDCSPQRISSLGTQEFVFLPKNKGTSPQSIYRISLREPAFGNNEPPFNADWNGLSFAQKMVVRAQYSNLTTNDEPPYPIQGLGELIESIRLEAEQLNVQGILRLDLKIGPDGKVDLVNVLESPDSTLSKSVERTVGSASFKAAVCAKQPCAMNMPIDVVITRSQAGVDSSVADEFKIVQDAAQAGDARAQNDLDERYERGQGTASDVAQAMRLYQQSAAQGNRRAQVNLSRLYSTGKGIGKDLEQAMKWALKAAELGDYRAQYLLGAAYRQGLGVPKDLEQGFKWYERSAVQGYAHAQNDLADCYETGVGVAIDLAQAVKWYSLAAEQRDRVAISSLSHMYAEGRGVAQDSGRALRMLQDAAGLGHPKAQYDLAQRYALGNGVTKDNDKALKWYRKAANNGNKDAATKLKELGVQS